MGAENKVVSYTRAIIRFRWPVIILTLFAVFLAGSGGKNLGFTSDYRVFFGEDNPQRVAFENLQETYTKNDNVMFVVQAKDGSSVFSKRTLEAIKEITKQGWQIPYSIRVDSITNYQHTYAQGDNLTVEDLVGDIDSLTEENLKQKEKISLSEPTLAKRLISPDARTTGVNVTFQLPQKSEAESREAWVFINDVIAKSIREKYPELHLAITGMVPMNNAFFDASMHDMSTLTPAMYLVILIVTALLLRSFSGTFITLLVIAFSTMTAMGIAGWLGIRLTPPSAIAPTIILTLSVADSIHILVTMLKEMRNGSSRNDAIIESMRINMHPVFLTSITTAIGFMSLNFSDAPPFHDLGNMSAIGVIAAFIYSVVFLPAFVSILPFWVKVQKNIKEKSFFHIDNLSDFIIRNRKKLLYGMSIITVVLGAMVPSIELNDKFIEYFDDSVAFRRDSDFAQANLSGSYIVEFSVESGKDGGVSDPEFLKSVQEFSDWLRVRPEVDHVNTITDVFKRLNRNMHADKEEWYKLPEQRDLAAQYLLLYEMSLPYGLDLNNQINISKSATRVTVTLKNISTVEMRKFADEAGAWFEGRDNIRSDGASSPTMMFAYISERNINGMLIGTTISLILISGLLVFALRDPKHGLLSLIPNLVPAIMAFGIWALFVGEVGMGVSIVVAMCLGIIVDDTVHFLSKYVRGIRENKFSDVEAVRYAFSRAGTALIVTSIIIVSGFLILSLSPFKVNSQMGTLNAIIISSALIADFLLLPPLLMAIHKHKEK